jgi:hypothetical protein
MCRRFGSGMACARFGFPDRWPVAGCARAAAAVDGVLNGPLSKEQLVRQPVAAGPTKVGLNVPRLDVVAALGRATV